MKKIKLLVLLLLFSLLINSCSKTDNNSLLFEKTSKEITQQPINEKHFLGTSYDKSFLLTLKSGQQRILWFEKYKNRDKSNGLESYSGYFVNQIVVKLVNNKKIQNLTSYISSKLDDSLNGIVTDSIPSQNVYEITFKTDKIVSLNDIAEKLKKSNVIEYAVPNYVAVFDQATNQSMIEYSQKQWAYKNMAIPFDHGGTFDADMDGAEALSKYKYWRTQTTPIIFAVIDSGIDITHPALKPVLYVNTKEIPNNNIDDDNNGYKDDINGWNFANNNNDLFDQIRHGTHVAGIIAAAPTASEKMRGICPNAKILTLKISLNSQISKLFDNAKALVYCADAKVNVVNMSFGSTNDFPPFGEAVQNAINAGLILVASAGNDTSDLQVLKKYPACYPRVVTVAATTAKDNLRFDSNFETYRYYASFIDIAAPGDDIYSTVPGGYYAYLGGTSMAAPLVTGSIGLMKSLYPTISLSELLEKLNNSSDALASLENKVPNRSRLNLYRAIFQPKEIRDQNGVPYRDQLINGEARGNRIPYANWGDPDIDGHDEVHAFKISTMKQLMDMRDEDLDKFFILTNDLDYNSRPAGTPSTINKNFMGNLNGNGYAIKNITLQTGNQTGLFRSLASGAVIINLKFTNATIEGTSVVGIIAGSSMGSPNGVTLNNVQVEGTVKGSRSVGLFFGTAGDTKLINCYAEGTVQDIDKNSRCGGFMGTALQRVSISKSHASVKVDGGKCGGAAGVGANSTFENIYVHGLVTGVDFAGGLIGMAANNVIKNCYTEGSVMGTGTRGGLIGDVTSCQVNNCYSFSRVNRGSASGGLLGKGSGFNVTGSYFWSQDADDGAGGTGLMEYQMLQKESFVGWWNTGTAWSLVNGFHPSITLLPRSGPSLY
jgi:subtilisin family serine protease